MRLHLVRFCMAAAVAMFAVAAFTSPVSGQEKSQDEAKYKFHKGDVIKYEVKSSLDINMRGTDVAFLQDGNVTPLDWNVDGLFENEVKDVNATDGIATLERRVLNVVSSGQWNGEKFKTEWDSVKDKGKVPANNNLMDGFVVGMVQSPVGYQVDPEGETIFAFPEMDRLVMRRGMMFWPIKSGAMDWITTEEIAMPVLHDKIKLEFKNKVAKEETRPGRKVRIVTAAISVKEKKKEEGQRPGAMKDSELDFTAGGTLTVEFDLTNGRLIKLVLDLKVNLSGKAQTPDAGGMGDIKGIVTYKETQVLKD